LLHNDTHNLIIVTNVRASHTKKKKTIIWVFGVTVFTVF
jgi:hypothetical protein